MWYERRAIRATHRLGLRPSEVRWDTMRYFPRMKAFGFRLPDGRPKVVMVGDIPILDSIALHFVASNTHRFQATRGRLV